MKALVKTKRYINLNATRLINSVKAKIESGLSDGEIKIFKEDCAIICAELNANHLEISQKLEDETELVKHEAEYLETVAKLEEIRIALQNAFEASASRVNTAETSSFNLNSSMQSPSVRLPKIELPTFCGEFHNWLPFRDLFKSTIHESTALTNVQKLQYLKLSVKQPASALLDSLSVTSENYEVAWKLLCDRYNNEHEIIAATLDKILFQPNLTQESAIGLRKIMDTTNQSVQTLKSLKQPVQHWDTILIHILCKKLDLESQRQWVFSIQGKTTLPSLKDLLAFIDNRARAIATAPGASQPKQRKSSEQIKPSANRNDFRKSQTFQTSTNKCTFCNAPKHTIYRCFKFQNLSVPARKKFAKENSLCENCLRSHPKTSCTSSNCKKCNQPHNSLLHEESSENQAPQAATGDLESTPPEIASHLSSNSPKQRITLLPTAIIQVLDTYGMKQPCKALIDCGSQTSFVSERCVQRLGLHRQRAKIAISGLGTSTVATARGKVQLQISSRYDNSFASSVDALILSKVTGTLPQVRVDPRVLEHFKHLKLADEHCNEPSNIDVLLGADVFGRLLGRSTAITKSDLSAIDTVFGWVITGSTMVSHLSETVSSHFIQYDNISFDLQKFWEIEEIPVQKRLTAEEQKCEDHFQETFHRNSEGRYVVKLPFRDRAPLGASRLAAEKRLSQIERKLNNQPETRVQYNEFMSQYETLGHMTKVSSPTSKDEVFYLPHHCVFKSDGQKSKIRVVFDASAKSSNGLSLNDKLMVGPTLQADLATLLIQFRKHQVAMSADIVQMYRQVLVHPDDRNYQRILWRDNTSKPIEDFCLNTVTYGTASAPFLATKCLQQLAKDEKDFPLGSNTVLNSFYVDDLLTSEETQEKAFQVYQEVRQLLLKGGFDIRKWASNQQSLLEQIPPDLCAASSELEIKSDIKALGVWWNTNSDSFSFKVPFSISDAILNPTKRSILSYISKIFDPLGWLSPVSISLKILMQDLWRYNIAWDDPIPDPALTRWTSVCQDLVYIAQLEIPRYIFQTDSLITEIHGFCDASEKAYSAVVYSRTISTSGDVRVRLIASKTRVSPIKLQSLARLELCGAVLLASLVSFLLSALNFNYSQVQCWSDSTVVLSWLSSEPSRWKTFVAHRVTKINTLLPGVPWSHVSGTENPADCASRGIPAAALSSFTLWWTGPSFLSTTEPIKEQQVQVDNADAIIEERRVRPILTCLTSEEKTFCADLLERYSSLARLNRITAYLFRFIKNCRVSLEKRKLQFLSTNELADAQTFWIKFVQSEAFNAEISSLKKTNRVSTKSNILKLEPFLDSQEILRVGGRLRNSNLQPNHKHPALLPKCSILTELIVKHYHVSLLHAGPQLLQASIQQQFWIISARSLIRKILNRCVTCIRQRGQPAQQKMGDLPPARVRVSRPFSECGVDYAGPFTIRMSKASRAKTCKAYLALFVCFSTKATHCEIASDLTTVTFIAALKRFVARRGKPNSITSDCGTNFVGADNLIKDTISNELVGKFLAEEGIKWNFNPASAAHMGGLWESAVKSVKFHLKRILTDVTLTYEELYTVIVQVEACLNSRPLCPLSNDPNDFTALTPGHFLINAPLTALPEPDVTTTPVNRLSRWQLTQRLVQHFWTRWTKEYLGNLQQRPKWNKTSNNLQLGTLVLIKDERLPPLKWKMGRVIELHPGPDGLVRVVTIKTSSGQLQRHVNKLCVLPTSD